jgi:hypothetical protein
LGTVSLEVVGTVPPVAAMVKVPRKWFFLFACVPNLYHLRMAVVDLRTSFLSRTSLLTSEPLKKIYVSSQIK